MAWKVNKIVYGHNWHRSLIHSPYLQVGGESWGGGGGGDIFYPQMWPGLWRQSPCLLTPLKYWRLNHLRLRRCLWRSRLQRTNRRWDLREADRTNPVRFLFIAACYCHCDCQQVQKPDLRPEILFKIKELFLCESDWNKPGIILSSDPFYHHQTLHCHLVRVPL